MSDTINRVIVPGTFDPITFGHIDVIRRARRIFPSVIVAVAESQGKNGVGTTFMLDERVALAREALGDIEGVEVLPFTGLLVDFAREQGAGAVVKGLRAMTDFEYELQQADLNYRLDNELESIFVMSAPQYGYISSSVVRQIASLGSDVSTASATELSESRVSSSISRLNSSSIAVTSCRRSSELASRSSNVVSSLISATSTPRTSAATSAILSKISERSIALPRIVHE